jgi:hypothetical protein
VRITALNVQQFIADAPGCVAHRHHVPLGSAAMREGLMELSESIAAGLGDY